MKGILIGLKKESNDKLMFILIQVLGFIILRNRRTEKGKQEDRKSKHRKDYLLSKTVSYSA